MHGYHEGWSEMVIEFEWACEYTSIGNFDPELISEEFSRSTINMSRDIWISFLHHHG